MDICISKIGKCDHTCANVMKCAGVSIYSLVLIMVVRGILYVGILSVAFSCADASVESVVSSVRW